jgi:hypothetical protein
MPATSLVRDKSFLTGVIFAAIGGAALWFDRAYPIGSATAMGPGYFPMLVGLLLVVLGLFKIGGCWREAQRMVATFPGLRALTLLIIGVVAFGVCIDRFGLLPSVLLLVLCAVFAGVRYRMWEVVAILVVLGAITGALFVFGMGLPIGYLMRF